MRYLPALDGLRAVAVLAVVAYHAGLPVPAGFVGVDVFFVISGYLITRLLADELQGGRIDFLHFYARRARRILPAAVLVVSVTLALAWLLLPTGKAAVAESAAASGLFVANLFFQSATGDYWSDSAEMMPLLHLWSLSVEEQFYLLWPVLLIAVRRNPLPWLWGIAAGSFVLAEVLLWANPTAAFYQMPARAWELAAGGLVALGAIRAPRWGGLLGLCIVMAACLFPLPHFPGIGALPAVAGATLLIAGVHAGQRVAPLEARPMVWVGLISYSLYLWHWPLLAIDRATRLGEAPLSTRLALCGVAVLMAALSFRYVEQPFRRLRVRHGRTVFAGLACAMAVSVTALTAAANAPADIQPPMVKRLGCTPGAMQAPSCLSRERKVVLWGDSYATAWQAYALSIAAREGLPAVMFLNTGCYPTAEKVWRRSKRETDSCHAHNLQALDYIASNGAEVVVLAGYYAELFRDYPQHGGLKKLVADIRPMVGRIVVIAPTPELMDSPDRCKALGVECGISGDEYARQSAAARAAIATLGVEVVDPAPFLCESGFCPVSRGGLTLYADAVHVSGEAVVSYLETQQ